MVIFFVVTGIGVVIGWVIACMQQKDGVDKVNTMIAGAVIGMVLGVGASFWGGSLFVKKEIVAEKYFISPMIFDEKIIAGLVEEHDSSLIETDNYVFQIKEDDKTRLIKHYLNKRDIFFSLNEDEERYLVIRSSKTRKGMWVWFFYGGTGIIESKAVLKKGDNFLTLPRYYSL